MKSIAILTSGGDSQGMNSAVRAVAKKAMSENIKVYGIRRGYKGMLDNDIFEITEKMLEDISDKGGTFLMSARLPEFKNKEVRKRAAENLKSKNIDALVVIGGDGSFHGAHYLYEEHGIKTVGIPGTIDNDIAGTDYTIGYDTALNIIVESVYKLKDTAKSHERTYFVEVMGRNCGDLALYSAMALGANAVFIPEAETKIDDIVSVIEKRRENGFTYDIIIVSEGCEDTNEIVKKVQEKVPYIEPKVTVLGHLQRGGNPTAKDRILATKMGVYAVELLKDNKAGIMIGIQNDELVTHKLSYAWENYSKKSQNELDVVMKLGK